MNPASKSRKPVSRGKVDTAVRCGSIACKAPQVGSGDAGAPHGNSASPRGTTRARLLEAAVDSLIELGVARTSTLEVQRRTGLSRGALLHHFPSYADLLAATVSELVSRNEQGARRMRNKFSAHADPLDRAVRTLAAIVSQPSYLAELELWAVARTDTSLRVVLRAQERRARADSERVTTEVFFPLRERSGYDAVVALSLELLRGLALSGVLRTSSARREQLINQWVTAASVLLDVMPASPLADEVGRLTSGDQPLTVHP